MRILSKLAGLLPARLCQAAFDQADTMLELRWTAAARGEGFLACFVLVFFVCARESLLASLLCACATRIEHRAAGRPCARTWLAARCYCWWEGGPRCRVQLCSPSSCSARPAAQQQLRRASARAAEAAIPPAAGAGGSAGSGAAEQAEQAQQAEQPAPSLAELCEGQAQLWGYGITPNPPRPPAPPSRRQVGLPHAPLFLSLVPDNHRSIMCLNTHVIIYFIDMIMNA